MTSNRVKKLARDYQKLHGVKYNVALAAVTGGRAARPAADPVLARWAANSGDVVLSADVGELLDGGGWGVLELDVPITFITGPAGVGKSDLLSVVASSLSERYGPERVRFVRASVGAPVEVAASFLHMESEDPFRIGGDREVVRLLAVVSIELDHRNLLLKEAGAEDVAAARAAGRVVPELVVLVDDYERRASGGVLDSLLAEIGHVGRSLGVRAVVCGDPGREAWRSNGREVVVERADDGRVVGRWAAGGDEEVVRFVPYRAGGRVERGSRAGAALAAGEGGGMVSLMQQMSGEPEQLAQPVEMRLEQLAQPMKMKLKQPAQQMGSEPSQVLRPLSGLQGRDRRWMYAPAVEEPAVLGYWQGITTVTLSTLADGSARLLWVYDDDEGTVDGLLVHLTAEEAQVVAETPGEGGLLEAVRPQLTDPEVLLWRRSWKSMSARLVEIPREGSEAELWEYLDGQVEAGYELEVALPDQSMVERAAAAALDPGAAAGLLVPDEVPMVITPEVTEQLLQAGPRVGQG